MSNSCQIKSTLTDCKKLRYWALPTYCNMYWHIPLQHVGGVDVGHSSRVQYWSGPHPLPPQACTKPPICENSYK
eukprot:7183450-Ditylum_brightwellii.AAC.1